MSGWKKAFRRFVQSNKNAARRGHPTRQEAKDRSLEHICQLEVLEPRRLLAFSVLPIHLGMVYGEYATQDDFTGNRFELTWSGGQPGTQLTELLLNLDKDGEGISLGDCFFDIAETGRGVYGWKGFEIVENYGIDQVSVQVEDGGAVLRLGFTGFDPGDRLVFLIDVDEAGYTILSDNSKAEGAEFAGSWLTATFQAPHYYPATVSSQFVDAYGSLLADSGLMLPEDSVLPGKEGPAADLTAGAFVKLRQTPLPISLSGRVFEDANMNNSIDAGEPGLAGVELALWRKQGDTYVDTGLRATTDASGYYRFEATSDVTLEPGTYRIVQMQPEGYLSVGAQPGHVGGETRGLAESPNILTEIHLFGGEETQENNFGEVRPASICGRIFAERNLDGLWQPNEPLLVGVTVELLDAHGNLLQTTTTDPFGQYCFTGLMPGVYSVRQLQPEGYFDGADYVGSAGGQLLGQDTIAGIVLGSGVQAVGYDFTEIIPNSLSGLVYADMNQDGSYTPGEPLLAGVTVELLDADGNLLQTTTTNATGQYQFEHLPPGLYTVREIQPAAYLDGPDQLGSEGGLVVPPDTISGIR
ncbi:MAG: carboxypeptidase regulatory-like domain-containing protein, partial [Thermoguttaceae bacterium]|nr:carboxypeptidase regulatory-like domain-containing protein [Thermoguttaceae bacterium]